jgi:chemotaxis protein CheC
MESKESNFSGRMTQLELDSFRATIHSLLMNPSSSSLSVIAGESFEYRIKSISIVEPKYLERVSNEAHSDVCAVLLKSEGDLRAAMLLYLVDQEARTLAARLLGKDKLEDFDTLAKSSISEVANILFAGAFLNALYKDTQFKTNSSVPGFASGELRCLIESPVSEIGMTSDNMVMADSELIGSRTGISLRMLLVMSEHDARRIMQSSEQNGPLP